MLIRFPVSFTPLSLESGGKGGVNFCHSHCQSPERLEIIALNLNHVKETSSETFWHTQI